MLPSPDDTSCPRFAEQISFLEPSSILWLPPESAEFVDARALATRQEEPNRTNVQIGTLVELAPSVRFFCSPARRMARMALFIWGGGCQILGFTKRLWLVEVGHESS